MAFTDDPGAGTTARIELTPVLVKEIRGMAVDLANFAEDLEESPGMGVGLSGNVLCIDLSNLVSLIRDYQNDPVSYVNRIKEDTE